MKVSSVKKTNLVAMPRRIVLYGTHGIGKSTWAACAPNPVFIQTEDGLQNIDTNAFPMASSLADVFEAIGELVSQPHDFQTVVIDSADWLERLIWKQLCEAGGKSSISDFGFGSGYSSAAVKYREVLDGLDYLRNNRGMTCILLAHSEVTQFNPPDGDAYSKYAPKLHKQVSGLLQEWADEVLFANYKVYTKTEGKGFNERKIATGNSERVLYTTERPSHLAKNRLNLPPEIPFVYAEFHALASQQQATENKEIPF